MGIAQAVAVIPGISRSGATISTGLLLKNDRSEVARFSFLMVLLPIIGAALLGYSLHVILRRWRRHFSRITDHWFSGCLYFRIPGLHLDDQPGKKGQPLLVCTLLCHGWNYSNNICLIEWIIRNPETYLEGTVLYIDKPLTWTSFDVVNKIRRSLKVPPGDQENQGGSCRHTRSAGHRTGDYLYRESHQTDHAVPGYG